MTCLLSFCLLLAAAAVLAVPPDSPARRSADLTRQWGEQAFSGEAPRDEPERLWVAHDDAPGTAKVNRAAWGGPLRLGGKTYARGFGVNSLCVLRAQLAHPTARLLATIGLDNNVDDTTPASVRFRVLADGKEVLATPVMRPKDGVRAIDVPLGGARVVDLVVDDGGDGRGWDQGDWADARVVRPDGATVWLDELASRPRLPGGVPFSFVYGGKPSADLLAHWQRQVRDEVGADGVRTRTLTLTDPETALEVRAVARLYADTPGIDWTVHFTNRGQADTPPLEQICALDTTALPGWGSVTTLHRLRGSAVGVDDWAPVEEPLPPGAHVEFGSANGRTSIAASPFFTVDWGAGGVVTGLGWSGQWRAKVERGPDGALRMRAGLPRTHIRLRPGESIRSPRVLQVYWADGDLDEAHNLFRRTMLAHVMPRVDGAPVMPPIAHLSTAFYEMNGTTEANTLSHLKSIEGLGFEAFWLDAYWHRGGFPAGMGNGILPLSGAEAPDRFPRGLAPVRDAVHKAGMKFLMWFEPERVAGGTTIAREHPDWVISPAGDGSGLLDLGEPAAYEATAAYLKAAIREYGLDWLRIDYNIEPGPFWDHRDQQDPDRVGMAEIRYVEGLYRLWDELRHEFPRLAIDNCASGGTRIDLETCARSLPLWRTDDTIGPLMAGDFDDAALRNQVMTAGLTRYVPFSTSGQMGCTPYLFRSGFNGGIAFAQDCRPKDVPRAQLARAIAEAKRIRPYWLGDFHPLSGVSTSARDWCVMQWHRPDRGDGVVLAFRRHASPYASYEAALRGIDPAATYVVTRSETFTRGKVTRMAGARLQRLVIEIGGRPGSALVEYRRD